MTDVGPGGGEQSESPEVLTPEVTTPDEPTAFPGYTLTIGDIGVTADLVVTPNGHGPLKGSQWIVTDMTRTETKIPTFAIVLAIVFALLCLIGLLFLLIKEKYTTGYVEVTVRTGNVMHKTQIPVSDPSQVVWVRGQVSQAQALALQAP